MSNIAMTKSLGAVFGVLVFAGGAVAQQERVALVVGNNNYEHINRLSNPTNDATDMSTMLARLGFRVTRLLNASHADFNAALKEFTAQSETAAISLVFYAGHGMEMDGVNYLMPVDARLKLDTQVPFETVTLDQVLASTAGAKLRLVILDSCRNVPQLSRMVRTRASRSVSRGSFRGLDVSRLGDETLVAYAAAAGTEAADGTGQRNSPYTAALLSQLEQPKELGLLFRAARRQVLQATNGKQQPHEYHSLREEHFLNGKATQSSDQGELSPELTEARPEDRPPSSVHIVQPEQEALFWEEVKDSTNWREYMAYLEQFPNGIFSSLARSRLATLVDRPGPNGIIPLHLAVRNNNVDEVRLLLDIGASVNIQGVSPKGYNGWTPLHLAVSYSTAEMVRLLLDAGASVHATEAERWTPLHLAARYSTAEMVRLLLDAGASVHDTEADRWTPLHLAARYSTAEIVRLLLDAGASVHAEITARQGSRTAQDLATNNPTNDRREIQRLLE